MGKTKAEEIRKELNETRGTKEPKVYCRHYETRLSGCYCAPGRDRDSCLKIAQSYADGVGEQKVIVYDSEGEVCYPWEALKEKPTATVTAREFIEYLGGMAAMERRDEERRVADKDALWR
jgi:hypothetical protein